MTGLGAGCEEESFARVEGVLEVPEQLDFGDVQVGMTADLALEFVNMGSAPVRITAFDGDQLSGARYLFVLPKDGLTVLAGRTEYADFSFQPFAAEAEPFEVTVSIEIDGQDPRPLTLSGRGVENGLEISPNPLDFETVLAGSSRTLEVTLTNRLSMPVTLRSQRHRLGKAEAEPSSGSGTFDLDVATDPQGLLVGAQPLAPGASLTVPVTYAPDPSDLEANDRARWTISNCDFELCEAQLDLRGRGTTAALVCAPEAVDFGAVNPDATLTRTVTCTNVAADMVTVDDWRLGSGTAGEYALVGAPSPRPLAPQETLDIEVAFTPTQLTWDDRRSPTGTLVVDTTHAVGGRLDPVQVQLLGRAGGPTIRVSPAALFFGEVSVGTYNQKLLLVENVGLEALDVSLIEPDVAGTGAYSVDSTVLSLAPGGSQVITVRFTPPAAAPAFDSAVRFVSNDALNPALDVGVGGIGLALPPCVYRAMPTRLNFGTVRFSQTSVQGVRIENFGQDPCLINDVEIVPSAFGSTTAFSLVNGNQTGLMLAAGATVDIPIEYAPTDPGGDWSDLGFYISDPMDPNPRIPLYGVGEPLVQVECPPPVTTQAGVPITLSATGIAAGSNITGYTWALTSFPLGGNGTPNQWTPNPPNAPTVTFLPFIVGVYDVMVTMTDDVGRMASCTTQVTAEGQGLQVTMRWNGTGDVDLHVHDGNTALPWFGPSDCYFSNRTPLWNSAFAAATGPNPELDFDNTTANGPENTRILVPTVGTTYTIAAHNYSSAANRTVTMEIFCGGVLPQATYTSRPLQGTTAGTCTANDFWKVAQVTFTGANTCTVTPIDTYGPSSAACTAF